LWPEVLIDHVHAAALELGRLRVLVLVDHVLVDALAHQLRRLRLHPRGHERRQVQPRPPVEEQFVVDELVGDLGRHRVVGQRPQWRRQLLRQRRVGHGREGIAVASRHRVLRVPSGVQSHAPILPRRPVPPGEALDRTT
jgi:hypothetical protein